jgi:ATP phosphoribosyltransferase
MGAALPLGDLQADGVSILDQAGIAISGLEPERDLSGHGKAAH